MKEFDGETVKPERWETCDPSRPFAQRWVLLAIDGLRSTADERRAWDKRKNKKRRREAQARGPDEKGGPAGAEPNGDGHAVIHKLGQRVEYRWHEFKRVTPHADWAKLDAAD